MVLESIAAAWPLTLAVAAASAGWVRETRRRAHLNGALHELRRPLQALALSPPAVTRASGEAPSPGSLELALGALADLDAAINGRARPLKPVPIRARTLAEAAIDRWRVPAARAGRALDLRWQAGGAVVLADPLRAAQALDNLLANAIEHGGLLITLGGSTRPGWLRIFVTDNGQGGAVRPPLGQLRSDPGRGHGLGIASAIAAAHGGRLLAGRGPAGMTASLELPLAPRQPAA
jgi:signal transduction histidine kinase